MDKRIEIWNILHDGEITAISGEGSESLTMFVSIPYLRRRLKPLGDSIVLALEGLNRLEFRDLDKVLTTLAEEIEIATPVILSTESETMPIRIETTMGQLILDFQNIRFRLDTGQPIEYETIERACEEYWSEWEAKTEQANHRAGLRRG